MTDETEVEQGAAVAGAPSEPTAPETPEPVAATPETVGEVELEAAGQVLEAEEAAPETVEEAEPLLGVATGGDAGDTVGEVELQAEGEAHEEFIWRRHEDPFSALPPEGYVEHPDREHVWVHPDTLSGPESGSGSGSAHDNEPDEEKAAASAAKAKRGSKK